MTRVTRYRINYFVLLALVAGSAYLAIRATGNDRIGLAVAIVLLLIPGRVQGLILRPLFRGQRCLSHGNAGDAAEEFVNLIALIEIGRASCRERVCQSV